MSREVSGAKGVIAGYGRRPSLVERMRGFLTFACWSLSLLLNGVLMALLIADPVPPGLHPLLYSPPLAWLLPIGVALFIGLLLRRALHLLAPLITLSLWGVLYWPALGLGTESGIGRPGVVLTVVSNNVGARGGHSLGPIVSTWRPDFIVLQDARPHEFHARQFLNYVHSGIDEFLLVSRFPIRRKELVFMDAAGERPVAARFEVIVGAHLVAVYSVHMPSPRRVLSGFLAKDEGDDPEAYARWLSDHDRALAALVARLSREPLPSIVAGDFNVPPRHGLAGRLGADWTDAFAASGSGWGFTFPGDKDLPFSMGSPWLRIDYQFTSPQFKALQCDVEPFRRGMQHLSVVARYRMDVGAAAP